MFNLSLYKREMKISLKLFVIILSVLAIYIILIIGMYNPDMQKTLGEIVELMPELMTAFGMSAYASSLMEFLVSYLYGMLLIVLPLLFCILRSNALIAKYVEQGSMVYLVAAPVKRRTVALTQCLVLVSCITMICVCVSVVQIAAARFYFPAELDIPGLLEMNTGLMCLLLFCSGFCFLCSCLFSDTRHSTAFGAGIPVLMYLVQMLSNTGGKLEWLRYLTFFTLFNPNGILQGESAAVAGIIILFTGAVLLFSAGITVFCYKDLHI